jgi:phospholipid/cholesterol/gamma-HCH transport system substrate-binding protein
METRANYVMIGLFAILSVIAAAIFTVWIANAGLDRQYSQYDVVFEGPVRGLEVGGEVRFNGIKVGEVSTLSLARENPSDVVARIRVAADTPIKVDSVAELEPAGLTGLAYIQIMAGGENSKRLTGTFMGGPPVISSRRGQLDRLFQGGEGVISTTLEALTRVNNLLNEDNIRAFSATIANLERTTAALAGGPNSTLAKAGNAADQIAIAGADVSRLSRSVEAQSGQIVSTYSELGQNLVAQTNRLGDESAFLISSSRVLVEGLTEDANSLSGGAELTIAKTIESLDAAQKTMAEINQTAASLRTATSGLGTLVTSTEKATTSIDRFFALAADQTLPDISRAAQETRNTAITFDAIAQRVDQNPSDLISRPPSATVEWKR